MNEPQPSVVIRGVSKRYGVVHALRDVSLEVRPGEVLGLIGENGAGKSTLIGVLSGTVRPDSGEMTVRGEPAPVGDPRALRALGISVLVQEQALVDSLRVFENIFLGREREVGGGGPLARRRLRAEAEKLLLDLHIGGVDANDVVANLTYPQRQLVEIAKAFSQADASATAPMILLDEPTSSLTEHEVEILFDLIKRWQDRVSFIFVSHILQDVLRISTRLLVLRDGRTVETLANEGISPDRLHALMVGAERSSDYYHEKEQAGARDADPVLELSGAGVEGEFAGVDLRLRPGEIVGLAGVIGSGKSSVAAAAAGELRLTSGELKVAGRTRRRWSVPRAVAAGVVYVPPERAHDSVFPVSSVRENITIGILDLLRVPFLRVLRLRAERTRAAELRDRLQIKTSSLSAPIGELSGGNQQKAVFARWYDRDTTVMILNDPTRGIDVGTREEIYGLVREAANRGIAILLCGESLEELIGMSDRILILRDGVVSAEVPSPVHAKPTELDLVQLMM
ncbi:sugar ABC transporter ATP-binding protein [Herbidospora sp. RD11066]